MTEAKKDRIKLKDIQVITLQKGKLTTGRRSSPVPQLQCVGGSAGCKAFQPSSVQCYNRGFDGVDVQWQCKTDMDNKYKFGLIEVTCEGYDYPDDAYILVGSCGLEYTIDLVGSTSTGSYQRSQKSSYRSDNTKHEYNSDGISPIFVLVFIAVLIAIIYYTCLAPSSQPAPTAPPPGFRPEFFQNSGYDNDCHRQETRQNASRSFFGNNFTTGLLGGGILGYLFSRRPNYTDQSSYFGRRGQPSAPPYPSSYSASSSNDTSETRSASGFGGTRRR